MQTNIEIEIDRYVYIENIIAQLKVKVTLYVTSYSVALNII